jgi:uncharacterized membrane protein SpoIIM required for sporulation
LYTLAAGFGDKMRARKSAGGPVIFLLAILTVVMYLILALIEAKELREQNSSENES